MLKFKDIAEKVKNNGYDMDILTEEEVALSDRVGMLYNHKLRLVRHFKGGIYLILDKAVHTETGEDLVVYKSVSEGSPVYVRPLEMFLSEVDKTEYPNAEQKYRFEFI